jgi:hypothetical protein
MKYFLKKYWKFLTIIFVFSLIVVSFYFNKKNTDNDLPTPQPIVFKIESFFPKQGTQKTAFPSTAIRYDFSLPVKTDSIILTITPFKETNFYFENNNKTLYIQPVGPWDFNINYSLQFTATSNDGQTINSEVYTFNYKIPSNSDMTEVPI